MDEHKVEHVSEKFRESGYGMVMVRGFSSDEGLSYKCYSTISKQEVKIVLDGTSRNLSLMPFDLSSMINGDFIVEHPDHAGVKKMAKWAAEFIDDEPVIVAACQEGGFSTFGVGDVPMLAYMCIRVLTFMEDDTKGQGLTMFGPSAN